MRIVQATVLFICWLPWAGSAEDKSHAAGSINSFGLDLCRQLSKRGGNLAVSPYSLQNGFALAWTGAAGETKTQMSRVLCYPEPGGGILESLAELAVSLNDMNNPPNKRKSLATISVANRLFVDNGFTLKPEYLESMEKVFRVPATVVDLQTPEVTKLINGWVAQETKGKIPNILPNGAFAESTHMFLVNAFYLKAPWAASFLPAETKPFYAGEEVLQVPTMRARMDVGYLKTPVFTAAGIPMAEKDLQLLILLPPSPTGLPKLEEQLTSKILAECANMEQRVVLLSLPKFKLGQSALNLGAILAEMGMKEAFDIPPGSANFEGMAERTPERYLFLSNVYHQVFFAAEEEGIEGAAASTVGGGFGDDPTPPPVTALHIDRPFFFAVQHKPTGSCLILGRVEKP